MKISIKKIVDNSTIIIEISPNDCWGTVINLIENQGHKKGNIIFEDKIVKFNDTLPSNLGLSTIIFISENPLFDFEHTR